MPVEDIKPKLESLTFSQFVGDQQQKLTIDVIDSNRIKIKTNEWDVDSFEDVQLLIKSYMAAAAQN